jgi:DNA ligase-1
LIETLPTLTERLMKMPAGDYVLDGEVKGRDWNETQSTVFATKNVVDDSNMVYHVFDFVPLTVWKSQSESAPYRERRDTLNAKSMWVDGVEPVEGMYVHRVEELLTLYNQFIEEGHEGAMVKDLNAPYQFKRTSAILKVKPKRTWEGRVVGHEFGKGRLSGVFAAFKVRFGDVVTSVGGGFTDQQRKDITADLEDNPKCYWGAIAEVEAQEMTDDGKLRFPVFKRFRNPADK